MALKKYNVKCLFNKDYAKGIGTSISYAIKQNKLNVDGVLILPGDMPLISQIDLEKLINAFYFNKKNKIISPKYKNKKGNPLIIPKSFFKLLKSLKKDEGARKFLPKNNFLYIEASFGTTFDIDTRLALIKVKILKHKFFSFLSRTLGFFNAQN